MHFRWLTAALLLLSSTLIASCTTEVISAHVWRWNDDEDVLYPELDNPEIKASVFGNNTAPIDMLGIAFSGGGTRAATATLGQLRALNTLNWLKETQYISAVSGGSWAAVPYTFLDENIYSLGPGDDLALENCAPDSESFLGRYCPPSLLTDDILGQADNGIMSYAIERSRLGTRYLSSALRLKGDESYAEVIGKVFLWPVGLNENKFVSWNVKDVDALIERSDRIRSQYQSDALDRKDDFYVVSGKRPFLIVGGSLFSKRIKPEVDDLYPVEFTAIYSGIPGSYKIRQALNQKPDKKTDGPFHIVGERYNDKIEYPVKGHYPFEEDEMRKIGGSYIETAALDFKLADCLANKDGLKKNDNELDTVTFIESRSRYRFTLSDMIAISGAAPQQSITQVSFGTNLGFPEIRHWAPSSKNCNDADTKTSMVSTIEYAMGDGGHIDNLGIMPLLRRKVGRIIVYINTQSEFKPFTRKNNFDPMINDVISSDVFVDDFIALFRLHDKYPFNTVFTNGERNLRDIYSAWKNAKYPTLTNGDGIPTNDEAVYGKATEPLYYCKQFETLENERHGIKRYRPKICFVYLSDPEIWYQQMGKGVSDKTICFMQHGVGAYEGFPHLKTFLQNGLSIVDYTNEQVNALSQLTAWNTLRASREIGAFLDIPTPQLTLSNNSLNISRKALPTNCSILIEPS